MPVTTQNRVNRLSGLNTLAYMGVESYDPPSIFQFDRDPTPHDAKEFRIGDLWLSGSGLGTEVWVLTSLSNTSPIGRAFWTQIGMGGSGLTFHTNSGDAVPNGGIVNVLGGSNIFTDAVLGAPNTINIGLNDNVVIPGTLKLSFLLPNPGVLMVDNLGFVTGSNGANGQVIIGGGIGPTWATLTAGAGIAITNGANSITITNTGGGGGGFGGLVGDDTNVAVPDGANQINVIGDGVITITNAAVANTLEIGITAAPGDDYLVGSEAGVAAWKQMTSTGHSVTITETPTTINFEAAGIAALTGLDGDIGPGATPNVGNHITIAGGTLIETSAGLTGPDEVSVSLSDAGNDGQVIIGSTAGNPAWATLTAGANVTIVNAANAITISATGGGGAGATSFPTNSGVAQSYVGVLNVYGGTNVTTTAQTIVNPNDTVGVDLNQVIYWPVTNAGGTTGVIYLGGNRFMHNMAGTFLGSGAGNLASLGNSNVGIGAGALRVNSCVGSTAIGHNSQYACTSGNYNTSTGFESLTTITTGDYATAYGAKSLHSTTASGNSAFGYESGYRVTSATGLALFGYGSGDVLTTGGYNSFFGSGSGLNVTTGTYNLNAGYHISSGAAQSYNTFLGYNAAGTGSSCIAIGGSTAARSNSIQIGTQGAGNGQVNTCYVAGIYGTALTGTTAPVYIDSNGKLGTGIAAAMPAFNYYQTADHNNVTGDGTEFYLAFTDLTAQYDPLGTVTAAGGTGYAMFTAPSSGMYHLNFWVTIGGLLPPPVPPTPAPNCPIFIRVTGTSAAIYALEGTVWGYQVTGRQSVFNAVDTYMTAGDRAYFSISIVFPAAPGVKDLDVIGVLGGSRKTFISGFKIA